MSLTHLGVLSIVNREYLFNDISIDNLLTAAYLERERFAVADTIVHHANENNILIIRGETTLIVSKYSWEGM